MRNDTISRMFGMAVGAAVIIAGLAVFGSPPQHGTPVARLYSSETVTVYGN